MPSKRQTKQQARQGGKGGGTSSESDRALSRAMARVAVCSCPACSLLRTKCRNAPPKARNAMVKRWRCESA